jgi:hypothetical protein
MAAGRIFISPSTKYSMMPSPMMALESRGRASERWPKGRRWWASESFRRSGRWRSRVALRGASASCSAGLIVLHHSHGQGEGASMEVEKDVPKRQKSKEALTDYSYVHGIAEDRQACTSPACASPPSEGRQSSCTGFPTSGGHLAI